MKVLSILFTLVILLVFTTGCDAFNDYPEYPEAKVNFRLVDAPAAYDEVWIGVAALRVKADYEGDAMDDNEESWEQIVLDGSQMVNLLDLTGGNSLYLGEASFPEGKIDQVRLILGENNYLVEGGKKINLKTPSAQQTGLKIKVDQEVHGGEAYDLVIDFDAAKSIVPGGNSENTVLKPVVRAFLDETEGIQGQVLPLDAEPVRITVIGEGAEFNTFADETGKYAIMGLTPGIYSITFNPNENYLPQTLDNVRITEEEVTTPEVVTLKARP